MNWWKLEFCNVIYQSCLSLMMMIVMILWTFIVLSTFFHTFWSNDNKVIVMGSQTVNPDFDHQIFIRCLIDNFKTGYRWFRVEWALPIDSGCRFEILSGWHESAINRSGAHSVPKSRFYTMFPEEHRRYSSICHYFYFLGDGDSKNVGKN